MFVNPLEMFNPFVVTHQVFQTSILITGLWKEDANTLLLQLKEYFNSGVEPQVEFCGLSSERLLISWKDKPYLSVAERDEIVLCVCKKLWVKTVRQNSNNP